MSIVGCGSEEIELISGIQSQFRRGQLKELNDDAVFALLGFKAYFSKEFFPHTEFIFGGPITTGSDFGESVVRIIGSNLDLQRTIGGHIYFLGQAAIEQDFRGQITDHFDLI